MRQHLVRRAGLALLLVPFLWLSTAEEAAAQQATITGEVTDARTMRPLAGAQVNIVGTTRGTLADRNGRFSLNVDAGTHTIRVTMLGYRSVEEEVTVSAGGTSNVELRLTSAALQLDEIVATGQAAATQRRAIGNTVSNIQADRLAEMAPMNNVREMMTARAPGLTYLANSGQAGAGGRIRIRGSGSFLSGNQEPVVYVDGIRVQSTSSLGGGSTVQGQSALDVINPEDIESIEIIKGPAASTLYGADAASGVIQIFTKKGRDVDQVQWSFAAERGESEWALPVPDNYFTCSTGDEFTFRGNRIGGSSFPGCAQFTGSEPLDQRVLVGNPIVEEKPLTLRTGNSHSATLSARGGGEGYNYYISFEESKEQGVYHNNFNNRRGGRANFTVTPSENFSFSANVGLARVHNRMNWANNSSNSILRNGLRGRPGVMGPFRENWRGMTPELSNMYNHQRWTERHTLGTQITWTPYQWWENRLSLGLDKSDRIVQTFYEIDTTGLAPFGATSATGTISRSLPQNHVYTLDYAGTMRYTLTDDWDANTSFGLQINRNEASSHSASGQGLVANRLNMVGQAAVTSGGQSRSEQVSAGFFVQEQLIWRDRVYATAAVRFDDNSAFGEDFEYVVYPKAQLAWVMSEEDFFDYHWVDEFRLRGAWGRAGSAPGPFTADRTFQPNVTTVEDQSVGQLSTSSFGNPDLKAETGQELELGFDASLLDGRLSIETTYYSQSTQDALLSVPVPQSSGWTGSHLRNVGEIKNWGWEFLITGTPVYNPTVQWEVTTSIATNQNELVSFGDAPIDEITFGSFASVQRHRPGYPLGGYWAVDVQRDANGVPVLDANGNAIVLNDREDEIYMGPMLPTREIGFSNTVTLFGNLQLYAHLDYKGGNKAWCAICSVRSRIDDNQWEVNDPNATVEQLAQWTSLQTLTHIHDADFIKLRELSVTYRLPSDWAAMMRADRASLSLAARNWDMLWTNYKPYRQRDGSYAKADPEVQFSASQTFSTLDYASTPMTRRLTASLRVQF
jgi:TonB-dependent starch-binding outer membrane protein SusC